MRYFHIAQHDQKDCGAACLSMICAFYGKKTKLAKCRELIQVDTHGASIYGVVQGAKKLGLEADALDGSWEELLDGIRNREFPLPVIARIVNEYNYEHFVVLYRVKGNRCIIGDPGKSGVTSIPLEIFREQWQNQIIAFSPTEDFIPGNERKGSFSKFFRLITRQKKMLALIFAASIAISCINLFSSVMIPYVLNVSVATSTSASIEEGETIEEHEHDLELEAEEVNDGSAKYEKQFSFIEKAEEKLEEVFPNIKALTITVIALFMLGMVTNILRGYLLAETAKRIDIPLTTGYYDRLLDLPLNFFNTRNSGELMSRFSDTEKIRNAISTTTVTIMLDTIMAIGSGIILVMISKSLFLIVLAVVILYACIVLLFKRPIKHINQLYMESNAIVTSYLKESVSGTETIKSFQYEEKSKKKLKELFTSFSSQMVAGSVIYNTQESLVAAIGSIGIVLLFSIGGVLCVNGVITVMDLIVFYYLIGYFMNPVKNLINIQPEMETAIVAGARLNDILEAQTEDVSDGEDITDIQSISISDLDFCYGYRENVLTGVSMEIRRGEKIAIVGESGSGKSTLVKLLMKFYIPVSGDICYNGISISALSASSIRRKVAYVSQDLFLFADTLKNNLIMGNDSITQEQLDSVCNLCQLDEWIASLPLGIDSMISENGDDLSGGQKQRIALARAILRDPELIILDEATSHLDSITEELIQCAIETYLKGRTCIIIAHRLNTIKNCDRIYVMDHGTIKEQGNHDSLMIRNGLYAKMFRII